MMIFEISAFSAKIYTGYILLLYNGEKKREWSVLFRFEN